MTVSEHFTELSTFTFIELRAPVVSVLWDCAFSVSRAHFYGIEFIQHTTPIQIPGTLLLLRPPWWELSSHNGKRMTVKENCIQHSSLLTVDAQKKGSLTEPLRVWQLQKVNFLRWPIISGSAYCLHESLKQVNEPGPRETHQEKADSVEKAQPPLTA